MPDNYRIFGSELSPYSVKVRSYFRFKDIPHEWVVRTPANMAEFQAHAKLPLIPLVLSPDEQAMQDSTPIMEKLDALAPEPSSHPDDPALAFISVLLEEYGDEWLNKPMFHYRWSYPADQTATSEYIAKTSMGASTPQEIEDAAARVRERMVPRLSFVGSSAETRDQIEGSFHRVLGHLEPHLEARPYLLGGRPSFGDFGIWAQLYECSLDPTPSQIIESKAPHVSAWIERMLHPRVIGAFEPWSNLRDTLLPFLKQEVGDVFLPWTHANAKALEAGEKRFGLELDGHAFNQDTQKYHARSLSVLLSKYQSVTDKRSLDPILRDAGIDF